jgi:xylulokinase
LNKDLVLALDFGSTNCKALLIDSKGGIVSAVSKPVKVAGVDNAGLEINDFELRSVLFNCIKDAIVGIDAKRICIVSITGQATTTVCLDSSGSIVRPIISHFDTRANVYGKRLEQLFPNMSYTGLKIGANLRWIKEKEAGNFKVTAKVCDLKEYCGFLLTGEVTHDCMALEDIVIKELVESLSLDPQMFGKAHDYFRPIGLTKLGIDGFERIPVIVSPWDGLAGVIGSGLVREGIVADISGSSETIATPVPPNSKLATRDHLIPDFRLFYTSMPLGITYRWFKDSLYGLDESKFQVIEQEVLSYSSKNKEYHDLLFIPILKIDWLNWIVSGTLNFSINAKRPQIMRAVMEGITMTVKDTLDHLNRNSLGEVVVSGGGAKSDAWNQIRADILQLPVVRLQTIESGCLGAAILGFVSTGIYHNIKDASDQMVKAVRRYEPSSDNVDEYEQKYKRFLIARELAKSN